MADKGFIYLHRKILKSSVCKNTNVFAVWIWCLLKATHVAYKIPFGSTDIELQPGEFVTGRKVASKELHISPQTYRTCITYLKSTNRITTKSTNQFTIISIVNWKEYQNKPTNKSTRKLTNDQPTANQRLTTNNNNNNNITNNIYVRFEEFWNAYPNKKAKKKAEQSWLKINPSEYDKIMSSLGEYKKSEQWRAQGGRFVPYPSTWLNQERWNDEISPTLSDDEVDIKEPEYLKH